MRRHWQIVQTEGSPIYTRDCEEFAIVPVVNQPSTDLCGALAGVDAFSLAMYAESSFGAVLARTLERLAGAVDLNGVGRTFRLEGHRTRTATVQGNIRVADGRSDPAFFGGHSRLRHDVRLWEFGALFDMPVQLRRLKELEAVGVDVVEFPSSPAVDMRFARINLAQPVVICKERFRRAEESGRVSVNWS